MTVLLTIIIASILCGVVFSAMWSTSGSVCMKDDSARIAVVIWPDKDAKELEYALAVTKRQFEKYPVFPEIHIYAGNLSEEGKKEAEALSARYGAALFTGDCQWTTQPKDTSS